MTKRIARIAAWVAGVVIGLPLLALVFVLIFANTGAGRGVLGALVAKASGGDLHLVGLSGRFPGSLHLAQLSIRDPEGIWLTLDNVALDWSPLALLHGEAKIDDLTADKVIVARVPKSSGKASSGSALPPLQIALQQLRLDRIDLAAAVAGRPATLRASGHLRLASLNDGDVALDLERLDAPGSYKLTATMSGAGDNAALDISEPAQGLLAEIANLPDLGAISLAATLAGPRHAEQFGLAMKAGALSGNGKGMIDLAGHSADLDLAIAAPAMAPRPDLHWQSARFDLHLHGPFTSPQATGRLALADLAAAGGRVGTVTADLTGDRGKLDLNGVIAQITLPGAQPDLLAAAPMAVQAEAVLDQPSRPLTFTITHPLIGVTGQAHLGTPMDAIATVSLSNLAPFAALGGAKVEGHAAIVAKLAERDLGTRFSLDGTIDATGGDPLATKLIGENATLALAGSIAGSDMTLDRAAIDGRGLHLSAHGSAKDGTLDAAWGATIADIGALGATLRGPLSVEGHAQGPQNDLALTAQAHGQLTAPGVPTGPVDISINATGLPAQPAGRVEMHGQLVGAPISVNVALRRGDNGATDVALDRAQWKSLNAQGDVTVPAGAVFPLGRMQLRIARLADLNPLLGMQLGGTIDATLDTVDGAGKPQARLRANASQLAALGDRVDRATLDATISDPATHPVTALQIALNGITAANGLTGNAKIEANGPQEALALRLTADLDASEGAAHIAGAANADLTRRVLRLTALRADYRGEDIRLLGPAELRLANGIAVDHLRLGSGTASLTVAGRITPSLQATVSLRNATPALAKPFFPTLNASGTLALDARLGGTLAAPAGTLRATGRGLRMRNGAGGALPPVDLDADATLEGQSARIDVHLVSGANLRLQLVGTLPLKSDAPMDLHSTGNLNLALLDPYLTAEGRSVRGVVTLDVGVAGTMAAPRASGSARLANGSVQDFVQGIHITDVNGLLTADGDTLRVTQLSGRAGNGTIAMSGTIGVAAPMPISLTITAHDARPLSSDLLTATLDANLTVKGDVSGGLGVAGAIHVSRANIQIPDKFPQSVAVLQVKKAGEKAPPPAPPSAPIALDLTITAPEQVFVRGHGLDAEMGGALRISGTSAAPQIAGGFDLRHGNFSLAGQTLNFTRGRVAFDGYGLQSKLDPTINFVAESTANSITATLTVTGYADQPKIRLSSSPELPQDEILAQLLFGQSVKQLTPFQVVQIAQAVAAISGLGTASDPLAAVRKGLGLDRLSVGAASGNGPGATVEAGKYVANGVYVGTKQGTSGGTQAQVQIDLTKHLKLQTTLGTGSAPATGVTPQNDPGSSVGLTYQFEY